MRVRIKKIDPNAVIPSYAHDTDAGMDLTAVTRRYDTDLGCYIYGTGLAVEIPEGYVGLLFPRSSVRKYNLSLTNCVGVVDAGYRGEVMFTYRIQHFGKGGTYMPGDKIGQLIIMPYPHIEFEEVEELSNSERGEGGHGSTGN